MCALCTGGEDKGNDDSGEDNDQGARNYADLASREGQNANIKC